MLKFLKRSPERPRPRIPSGLRLYVVGDIHGHSGALHDVLGRIDADIEAHQSARAVHVFLGDYVDRGPASREVMERLIARCRSHEVVMLKGNHETMFLDFFDDPSQLAHWRQYGGLQTLISYGVKPSLNPAPEEQRELAEAMAVIVPRAHRRFIAELPTSFACGDYYFVHAGIRPGVPLKKQNPEDLLWIREDFLLYEREHEKIVVHGHTPVREPDVRPNRINLDVGAYATGRLACMVLDGDSRTFI